MNLGYLDGGTPRPVPGTFRWHAGCLLVARPAAARQIAYLFSKNPILLDQILDDMLLMLVHPASDRDDNKRKWIQSGAHRRILLSRPTLLTTNQKKANRPNQREKICR
jgi:hypothetical protein